MIGEIMVSDPIRQVMYTLPRRWEPDGRGNFWHETKITDKATAIAVCDALITITDAERVGIWRGDGWLALRFKA
jgi:hypothetical protein